MMKCNKCGRELPEDAISCPHCASTRQTLNTNIMLGKLKEDNVHKARAEYEEYSSLIEDELQHSPAERIEPRFKAKSKTGLKSLRILFLAISAILYIVGILSIFISIYNDNTVTSISGYTIFWACIGSAVTFDLIALGTTVVYDIICALERITNAVESKSGDDK